MADAYLAVGDGHELYYERIGRHGSIPIFFIHGGPGSGFTESHKKLFDLSRYELIFYDQRGSGKSRPYLSLERNTTKDLVEDIERLRKHLQIERFALAGASWGATLALLYAEAYPERVTGLSLMSVFLATHAEAQGFVDGSTAREFPVIWERFVALVPKSHQADIAQYYLDKLLHGTEEERDKFAYNWALYDLSLSTGESSEKVVGPLVRARSYRSLALMTAYYITHDFFLPEGAVLERAGLLAGIPTSLVQGVRDPVTPPAAAQALHAALPQSELFLLEGLHADDLMKKLFVTQTEKLAAV